MDPQPDHQDTATPTDPAEQVDGDAAAAPADPADEGGATAGAAPTEGEDPSPDLPAHGEHAHADDLVGDWAVPDVDLSHLTPSDDGEPDDDPPAAETVEQDATGQARVSSPEDDPEHPNHPDYVDAMDVVPREDWDAVRAEAEDGEQ